jgi:hypothetical protein
VVDRPGGIECLPGIRTDGGGFSFSLSDYMHIELAGRNDLAPNAGSFKKEPLLVLDWNAPNGVVMQIGRSLRDGYPLETF